MFIDCLIDGELCQVDAEKLILRTGGHEDENEIVSFTEYRLRSDPQGVAVHRSVAMHLKKPVIGEPVAAAIV